MSRVGKYPVPVPDGVNVSIADGIVTAKGKGGELTYELTEEVITTLEDNQLVVKPKDNSKKSRSMWGTTRARLSNLVNGVATGFTRKLEINGVGYRAQLQGNKLNLALGFSHDVSLPVPEGIKVNCPSQTEIEISGADKQSVGQFAAVVRGYRPPEPYKGKGVKYAEERILRKEGKKK